MVGSSTPSSQKLVLLMDMRTEEVLETGLREISQFLGIAPTRQESQFHMHCELSHRHHYSLCHLSGTVTFLTAS